MSKIKLVNGEKFIEIAVDGAELTIVQGTAVCSEYEEGKKGRTPEMEATKQAIVRALKKIEAGFEFEDQESADALADLESEIEDFEDAQAEEKENEKAEKERVKAEERAQKDLDKENARLEREAEKARLKAEKEAEKAKMKEKSDEEISDELDELE